jgi:uncharacterized protein (TIGR00269 family)
MAVEKCSKCGSDAVVFLHYVRKHFCAEHFRQMFDKRFRSTVREFSMIKKGDRIAVGLSGGKDSTVLLRCLAELGKDLPMELVAITVDEGISGYRDATLKIAKKEAKGLGIEHRVVSFRRGVGKTLDSILKADPHLACSYCGVIRRGLLNRAARDVGADKLAMGHNLDDAAQTLLMNILRNEPERITRFIEPTVKHRAFVPRIRPLLRTPEKEVAIYAMVRGIEIERKECPYARSAFRQVVRRQLNEMEESHPGTKFKVLGSFLAMERLMRGGEGGGLAACSSCGEPASGARCRFCEMVSAIK